MSSAPPIGGTHSWRWVAIVSVSLLIHVAALDALPQWALEPADPDASARPLRAILLPPAPMPAPERFETAPAPQPAARPARTAPQTPRTPRLARLPDFVPKFVPEFVPESLDDAIPNVDVALNRAGSPPRAKPATPEAGAGSPAASRPDRPAPLPTPDALAPVSARLDYKVVAVERKNANPVSYYGVGSIGWTSSDGRYRSDLKAAVDFLLFKVNVLASHSEGAATAAGLAPDRYTETPRKRATVATSFNRDARQSITFSSSTATAALVPGAQDRLSVLFQIGALLRANADLAHAGGRIEIPVAGVRGDVETWVFETRGIETIDVGTGPLSTAHLRRTPKPGTNDKTIDIWIAHADGGYPARVLYTEPDGSTIEMTLEKIEAAG